jgi:hypothetical protein
MEEPAVIPNQAEQELMNYLGSSFVKGNMYASDICKLSFFIARCGHPTFDSLAVDPDSHNPSQNASRKCVAAFGVSTTERDLLHVAAPVCSYPSGERSVELLPINWLQTVLIEEFQRNPDAIVAGLADLDGIPNWRNNKARQAAVAKNMLPIPYGLFVDAAAFAGKGAGTRQSLVAYYVNLISQARRRCIFLCRKDALCPCPCRGRCTLDAVDLFLLSRPNMRFEVHTLLRVISLRSSGGLPP